jgi:hypothetical protein
LPSEAEVENIKPLLAHIQGLKSAAGGGLIGTQLMSFFLQRRTQPLKSRISKLWTYSGLTDPSRVSARDPEKKDLDKRVRSLTILTAKMEILTCLAPFFDSTHPLPEVCDLQSDEKFHFPAFFFLLCVVDALFHQILCRISNF